MKRSPSPVWFAGCAVSDFDATPGISDAVLLERAVRSARVNRGRGYHARWAGVMDAFGLGSTYARDLCRRFDIDPDEKVKR